MPNRRFGEQWALEISTADPELEPGSFTVAPLGEVAVMSRSLTVFKRSPPA